MLMEAVETPNALEDDTRIPADAAMLMSALDAGADLPRDRRIGRRGYFRVKASIQLFSDHPSAPPTQIFTRDISSRSLGFLTCHRLALGHGGVVELPLPTGVQRFHCTLLRCREVAPGWYEGAVYFNREQPQFNRAR